MSEIFTYLMKSNNLYKIGQSRNPKKRLTQIKTGNPKVSLITYGKGVSESILHVKYSKQRVNGEWFKLNNKQQAECISLIKDGAKVQEDSNNYNAKLYWVIPFGKYKGRELNTMTSKEEINYIKWFVKTSKNKKSKSYKHLKWWLGEMV